MSWRYDRENDWDKYKVKKPSDIPKVSHLALMVFEQRTYAEAGWGPNDSSSTGYYTHVDYYAFTLEQRSKWELMISNIYADRHSPTSYGPPKEEIVFFQSSGRGEVDVKVNVVVK